MKTLTFERFVLTTNLDEKGIDMRHMSTTYVQIVGSSEQFRINGGELCAWHAETFLNGDQDSILEAIKSIWESRQYHTDLLKGFYFGVI